MNGSIAMAYNVTGTSGNDTLVQAGDPGPGVIVGLAGNDLIVTGGGSVVALGNTGSDTIDLQAGNFGSVWGGFENDSIIGPPGTLSVTSFGNAGADTIDMVGSEAPQTVIGGDDSSDGNDTILTGTAADLVYGNGGNDTIQTLDGRDTMIGGFGNDSFFVTLKTTAQIAFGNEGNDTFNIYGGEETIWAGQGNDCIFDAGAFRSVYFGNEGGDTIDASGNTGEGLTVVGANQGSTTGDGADSILTGSGIDQILGNIGNDTIDTGDGADTAYGGAGHDSIVGRTVGQFLGGNEGNDTISGGDGADSLDGDIGNDSLVGGDGADTLQAGGQAQDTLRGGAGNDSIEAFRFNLIVYGNASEDGDNAIGGGPVETIDGMDFSTERFATPVQVTFAVNMGAGTGTSLATSANNAIAAARALNGGTGVVAAEFTFNNGDYLVIDQGTLGVFDDTTDLLLGLKRVDGTISAGNFTTI
jgi:Ca2+-binding RTX toxin-like protein